MRANTQKIKLYVALQMNDSTARMEGIWISSESNLAAISKSITIAHICMSVLINICDSFGMEYRQGTWESSGAVPR